MLWYIGLALLLLFFGWLTLRRAGRLQQETGLPLGRLVYADSHSRDWRANTQPLYSPTHHLTGKPDYLVQTGRGLIPVEVKSSPSPEIPYLGHILQVAAYCLLVEDVTGTTPSHGLLKYADALYEVDFTRELRRELLDTMAEMRQGWLAESVARSHTQPNKCAACRFQPVCDQALR
jgi:CRISPR-associated exonuclease Cas4